MRYPSLLLVLAGLLLAPACASSDTRSEGTADSTGASEPEREPGYLELVFDEEEGTLRLAVPDDGAELLYYVSLVTGLGSNDVGLDRGQLGPSHVVRFRRIGGRVQLVAPNLEWRSSSDNPTERRAAREAFAESVLASFELEEAADGRWLLDATDFLLRDAHGIASTLARTGQGSFRLDGERSALLREATKSFPDNTEVEALLTFAGDSPGGEVRATTPVPGSVSLRVRHSFVRLPDLAEHDYRPRDFDPRAGYFSRSWHDVSTPLAEPMEVRVTPRHHLRPGEELVYYIDSAAPEPVRTALLEGARYWVPAFEAAGQRFRVEVLPEGADPQDVRYNTVQWVHRSTRGWSYGNSVSDPRTGEILKGHVTLGALRVRQDILLFEGLLSRHGAADPRVEAAALARLRQLSAHEIGHTLGLAHNFAASENGRASVMDYPAPLVTLLNPEADLHQLGLADAYREGCGAWDELVIRYGYTNFAAGAAEAAGLAEVLRSMGSEPYLSDRDARGADRSHPRGHLWDNGRDPVEALADTYRVRRAALDNFSRSALRPGRSLGELERVFVPVYLHHRYQLEATVRLVGGVEYDYAVVGQHDGPAVRPVPAPRQRAALERVLESLDPAFLDIDEYLVGELPPPAPGFGRGRESFSSTGPLFDPLTAARTSARLTLDLLLDPARMARLVDGGTRGADLTMMDVLEAIRDRVLLRDPDDTPFEAALREEVQYQALESLMDLAADDGVPDRVRGRALEALRGTLEQVEKQTHPAARLHAENLRRFFEEPLARRERTAGPRIPPGSPIGCGFDGQ